MRDYIVNHLNEFEFPEEAKVVLLKAFDDMRNNEKMAALLDKAFSEYENNTIDWDKTAAMVDTTAEEMNLHKDTAMLVYLICMTKHTKKLYEEKNLSHSLFVDTFKDFNYKLKQCYESQKVWGVACYRAWFTSFYIPERFAFGRLQFEIRPFRGKEPYTKYGVTLNPEDPVINIHIPASGPLTHESVDDAFKKAYEFFKDKFEGEYLPIMCHSWLLFPEHFNMLSEKSNIYRFAKRFDPLFTDYFDNYDVPFFALYKECYNGDINSYSPDNSLKRGYIELVKQNKPCGTTCGIVLYRPDSDKYQ